MDKILAVARREFLATVRTKAFVLSVVLMPGIIIAAVMGGEWVEKTSREEVRAERKLAVIDESGAVYSELEKQAAQFNEQRPNQPLALERIEPENGVRDRLGQRILSGELYGYIVIHADALALDGQGALLARKDNQLETGRILEQMISEAIYAVRFAQAELDPARVLALRTPPPLERVSPETGEQVQTSPFVDFMVPFAFMFLLFMGTFGISQGLLTTLIEEKGSRVIELLLSAVSPTQLLAGKIVGMVAVGFLLMAVWGTVAALTARKYEVGEIVSTYRLLMALLYFVPGFLFISALMAAIGSACNELKDAQSMAFPLSLITIVPMILWFYIAEHPTSAFSLVLSYIPPITPFVMILRICADPHTPVWQIISTLVLMWLCVIFAIWAAGKIFRIGVLMYGKPPSLLELARWVRYS